MHQGKLVFSQLMAYLPFEHICVLRSRATGRTQGQGLQLPGPVLRHGLRPVEVPGVAARHRGQLARTGALRSKQIVDAHERLLLADCRLRDKAEFHEFEPTALKSTLAIACQKC